MVSLEPRICLDLIAKVAWEWGKKIITENTRNGSNCMKNSTRGSSAIAIPQGQYRVRKNVLFWSYNLGHLIAKVWLSGMLSVMYRTCSNFYFLKIKARAKKKDFRGVYWPKKIHVESFSFWQKFEKYADLKMDYLERKNCPNFDYFFWNERSNIKLKTCLLYTSPSPRD